MEQSEGVGGPEKTHDRTGRHVGWGVGMGWGGGGGFHIKFFLCKSCGAFVFDSRTPRQQLSTAQHSTAMHITAARMLDNSKTPHNT